MTFTRSPTMIPLIHTYVSTEPMVRPNAFIVEAAKALVIVDTTLTMSDSKALSRMAHGLGKPIAGILLTHGHPDHVAGTTTLAPRGEVPIYALRSVQDLMKASEQPKHAQWSALFKDEWIPRWVYPNTTVDPGQRVSVAGLTFTVVDLGAGGDSDANSIWLLEDDRQAAFVGDFLYSEHHAYMMDGSILRWLANLTRLEEVLERYGTLYVGHGPAADRSLIRKQQEYFRTACAALLEATGGTAVLTPESTKVYEERMLARYPGYGFTLTVALSAGALARELTGVKNYDW
jgi:glyoxylase-like metal-dependent hydrolase (beta-lactamase superfamily II)